MILASYKDKNMSCCETCLVVKAFGVLCGGRDTVENVELTYYVCYYNKVLTKPERDVGQNFIQIRKAILSILRYIALCRPGSFPSRLVRAKGPISNV